MRTNPPITLGLIYTTLAKESDNLDFETTFADLSEYTVFAESVKVISPQ